MNRRRLPNRHHNETIKFRYENFSWFAQIGRYGDGDIGEVFLTSSKTGSLLLAMAKDCSIAASLALQYGVPENTLREALTRDSKGEPGSPLSKALDLAANKDK